MTFTNAELDRIDREHQPNTPRTHDSRGQKVTEPLQCRHDLRTWPCDTRRFLDWALEVQKWLGRNGVDPLPPLIGEDDHGNV